MRSQIKRKGNKTEFLLAKIRESSGEIAKIQEHIRIMWLMRVNETLNETGVISFSEEEFMTLSKVWEIKVDLVADCFN